MKARFFATPLIVAAFLAVSGGLRAADAPKETDKSAATKPPEVLPVPAGLKKQANTLPAPSDVQKAMDQFSAKRDAIIAGHQALLDQLKTATAAQRQAILDQMQAQQKDLLETQRALGRQIRDELRKLRQSQPAGVGR